LRESEEEKMRGEERFNAASAHFNPSAGEREVVGAGGAARGSRKREERGGGWGKRKLRGGPGLSAGGREGARGAGFLAKMAERRRGKNPFPFNFFIPNFQLNFGGGKENK